MKNFIKYLLLFLTVIIVSCSEQADQKSDPLPSWNEGNTKQSIIDFVNEVTNESSSNFVKPEDRIATFDNDGTLWCEKPAYIHLAANIDRYKEMIKINPALAEKEPFKAIATKDLGYFKDLYESNKLDVIVNDFLGVPFEGMTVDEFAVWNRNWFDSWEHPRFKVGYRGLIYQPMVELVTYLRNNGFSVHIFTADEDAFLKLVALELYGTPPENVHGSSVKLNYVLQNRMGVIVRTAETNYIDNWDGKPRLIYQTFGKRPIFAAGNSNGDLQMLQYVAKGKQRSLAVLVHHTDEVREYKYDTHTENVIPMAEEDGWLIIDMRNDWKIIFPELNN